jgi:hypothetical protein
MNYNNIIKLIFILVIVYLFLNPTSFNSEKFTNNNYSEQPFKINIKSADNKLYTFISFFDLKPEYQKIVLQDFHKKLEIDIANKTSFSFLRDESPNNLTLEKLNEGKITPELELFSKVPVFIISNDDLIKYTDKVLTFKTFKHSGVNVFTPDADKYLFYNPIRDILYFSSNDNGGLYLKVDITTKDGVDNFNVYTLKNPSITNITPVQMTANNDVFTYYTFNNTTPDSYTWTLSN